MADLSKLKQIVERELANLKVYQDANEVIQTVIGLQQNKKELEDAVAKLLANKENLEADEKSSKAKVALAHKSAAEIVEGAKATALLEATAQKALVEKQVDALKAKSKTLTNECNAKEKELTALGEKSASAEKDLAKILDALAAARANVKNLIGE